ncbi:MAG: 23S rRNA (pseudouridine(1915)-N(3))-methyltransferase RlmH [Gammaproteobacteria bacterium]
MRFELLCVSKRPVKWVTNAGDDYLSRLKGKLVVSCRELPPVANAASAAAQRDKEGDSILRALPPGACTIALDERGEEWSTGQLAQQLDQWRQAARDVVFVIGGAEGLSSAVQAAAARVWALSRLTLPHQLVRVIVLEQIYRAWSLSQNHPYHRV